MIKIFTDGEGDGIKSKGRGHTYEIIIWKEMLNNLHNLPNLKKKSSREWKEFVLFWKV